MIRVVVGMLMSRCIERERPLPGWLAAAARRSRGLNELERRLRSSHARLSGSIAGMIDTAPQGLAARTVANLPRRRAVAGAARMRRAWPAAALGGIGVVAAAAAVALVVLLPERRPGPGPAPPSELAGPAVAAGNDPATRALVTALNTTPDEFAADALSGSLLAEAQRLRDDTRAAAGFVLSRIRILGGAPRETGG